MNMRIIGLWLLAPGLMLSASAEAQTSSIGAQQRVQEAKRTPAETAMAEAAEAGDPGDRPKPHPVYEHYSWITPKPRPPKTFEVEGLITIIVRQSSKYESDGDLKTDVKYKLSSDLGAFVNLIDGGLGAAVFSRGKPNFDYKFQTKTSNKADTSREDKFITRITAKIIDVKPNGNLVLEGRAEIQHGDERSEITITGTCAKDVVTADNTILSTQLANLRIKVHNEGAIHDASRRGWLAKFLDALRPF